MDKTIFVLLDACQYEAASKYLGYLEHMIDYNKGAKYKVLAEYCLMTASFHCAARPAAEQLRFLIHG